MNLIVSQYDHISLVQLPQEIMASNANEVSQALKLIIDKGHIHLILDLRALYHIDSNGLGVLIEAYEHLSKKDGNLILLSPSSHVQVMIELTRLHRVFEIYQDKGSAIMRMQEA